MNDNNLYNKRTNDETMKPTAKEWETILRILSLERENNQSTKKYSQQEIVNKILTIIRKEVENENHENRYE